MCFLFCVHDKSWILVDKGITDTKQGREVMQEGMQEGVQIYLW